MNDVIRNPATPEGLDATASPAANARESRRNPSFVVYIDESGCEGFSFERGSSDWFILGAAVTRKSMDIETTRSVVQTVREKLKYQGHRPLHFADMRHEHRVVYVDQIARCRIRTVVLAVHKPSLQDPGTFSQKGLLYRYVSRFLLERVSWCCRDHGIAGDGDGSSEIVFSHRNATNYQDMRDYLCLLKTKGPHDIRIDWSVVKPEDQKSFRSAPHRALMGLQIADAVASSFWSCLEPNPLGFVEPRYAKMLRPVVYSHQGTRIGYGLKLYPSEAASIKEAGSIGQFYQ